MIKSTIEPQKLQFERTCARARESCVKNHAMSADCDFLKNMRNASQSQQQPRIRRSCNCKILRIHHTTLMIEYSGEFCMRTGAPKLVGALFQCHSVTQRQLEIFCSSRLKSRGGRQNRLFSAFLFTFLTSSIFFNTHTHKQIKNKNNELSNKCVELCSLLSIELRCFWKMC